MIIQTALYSSWYLYNHTVNHNLHYIKFPVPVVDQNTHADSYTEVQVDNPYTAINNETYPVNLCP